jgi:hypothetical protein
MHRQDESAEVFLLLTVVVAKAQQDRMLQLITLLPRFLLKATV